WPYDRVLALLSDPANVNSPATLAQNIAKTNIGFYLDYTAADVSTDTSVLEIGPKLTRLIRAIRSLTTALGVRRETPDQRKARLRMSSDELATRLSRLVANSRLKDKKLVDSIVLARHAAQGYKTEQFVDLWDFCSLLHDRLADLGGKRYDDIKDACLE